MDQHTTEERRFNKIYFFVILFGLLTMSLITAIVFCSIPKENQQSANMALAFCMSAFTGLMGYLIGASPEKKGSATTGNNNTSNTITIEPKTDA